MSFRLPGAAALCIWLASACAAPAGVIISEIMYNPQGSDNDSAGPNYTFSKEWVEIYNPDDAPIDIGGWQFGDSQDDDWATPFPGGTTLAAGQALVVTGDAAAFDANWGGGINRIEVDAFPNQANSVGTNEGAALRNHLGAVQDVVKYQEPGWPTASGSDGNSIFLLPSALSASANNVGTNWKPSSQGVYGGRWVNRGGEGENHGSPGVVATELQTPFAPSPDAAWSMVVIPDTQNYVKSAVNAPIFTQMTNWIKDNRDQFNIQLVMQEGDIVNKNNNPNPASELPSNQQWANARASMSVLDGFLPYIMTAGNHDIGINNAENRETQFNTYFQPSQNPLNDGRIGGILKGQKVQGELENSFFELNAPDGRKLLIFALEYWPRQASIDWANQVAALPKYADHTAVLLTHSYMNWNEERWLTGATVGGLGTDGNDGDDMWNELVKLHGNFEMTFNGHIGGDGVGYKRSVGNEGNPVYQMLLNTQFETNGGNGWLRVVEFLEDGATVRVRTYSPYLDLYRENPANQFEITLSPLPMTPGDFNADGLVNNLDLNAWRSHAGMSAGAMRGDGDADADGDVDGSDFLAWQRNFSPAGGQSAAGAVPEPASLVGLCLGLAALAARRRRSR